jgi:hypothetical protein
VVPGRILSVESGSETPWRASRKREKTGSKTEVVPVVGESRVRCYTRAYSNTLSYSKTERCARASALAGAVASARGSSMMRTILVLRALVMRASHRFCVVMICRSN